MTVRSFLSRAAVRRATIAAAALFVAAPAAHAQWSTILRNAGGGAVRNGGTAVYEGEGRVDQEIRVELRDNRASIIRVGSRETIANSGRELSAIPREPGRLSVERLAGRGSIDVIQQPTASNGYTAVLRLVDNADGASIYHLIAYWQPTNGGDRAGNGTYGDDGRSGRSGHGSSADSGYDRDGYDRDGYDRDGYDRNGRDRRGGYRNGRGDNGHGRGHAYGHDKQDRRDDKADRKREKDDDKRDRKADKRHKHDRGDDQDDDRDDDHDHDHEDGRHG